MLKRLFYQDRLGTNVGKKGVFWIFCRYVLAMRNYASLLAPTNATGAAHWTAKADAVSANVMKHLWDSERGQLKAHIYNLHSVPGSSKNWSVCGDKWGSTEHAKDGGGAQNVLFGARFRLKTIRFTKTGSE